MVPAGQVGAADRALEHHIADQGEAGVAAHEHDAAGRVSGGVPDIEGEAADGDGIALGEPAIRRDRSGIVEAVTRAGLGQGVEQEPVRLVRPLDGDAEPLLQLGGAAGMVDMAMRQQDLLDLDALRVDRGLDPIQITSGIDHSADLGGVVPNQGTILLERGDRDDRGAGRGGHADSAG